MRSYDDGPTRPVVFVITQEPAEYIMEAKDVVWDRCYSSLSAAMAAIEEELRETWDADYLAELEDVAYKYLWDNGGERWALDFSDTDIATLFIIHEVEVSDGRTK